MARYCDQCGEELKQDAVFCSKCGAKCDLPPETNESVEEKVDDTVSDKKESINENSKTIGSKIDSVISNANSGNGGGAFNFSDIGWNVVIKYAIASTIVALILGIILFSLFYGNQMILYSFIIALIISVLLFTAHIENKINAIVVGLAVGLLTSVLQSTVISIFYGVYMASFFSMYTGSYTLGLIVLGPICGYIGNVYLKDKINFSIINQYLGE